jgi:hypothetical protein
MMWEDGSKIYLEQTCHHPPISHFLMLGPNGLYRYHGHANYKTTAGLNSFKLQNKGMRHVEFQDGTKVDYDYCFEQFSNSFFGTMRHESIGETRFWDKGNNLECVIKYGSVKKK